MEVTVFLKNPPANSDGWALGIIAHDLSGSMGGLLTSLEQPVIHEDIPSAWFPLYAFVGAYVNRIPIWRVTSDPRNDWVEWYNPDFIIPSPGNYVLDATTEQFEVEGVGLALYAGENFVVYTGKAQSAADALASIAACLDPTKLVYYWNNLTGLYELVMTTTLMVPYGIYRIEVTQDCTWTYGAEATAPSSVQLYSRAEGNTVPYLGSAQSAADALASIAAYLDPTKLVYYYNNVAKEWKLTPIMVPNGVYSVEVTQNVLWKFEEAVLTSIEITAPDSAEEGREVEVSTEVTNLSADSHLFRVRLYAARDIFAVPAPEERIGSFEVVIGSGQSQVVSGSFIMPAWDTNFLVMVHRFIDFWDFDNSASKVISLEVLVPEFIGTIIKKELEYNDIKKAIPVS